MALNVRILTFWGGVETSFGRFWREARSTIPLSDNKKSRRQLSRLTYRCGERQAFRYEHHLRFSRSLDIVLAAAYLPAPQTQHLFQSLEPHQVFLAVPKLFREYSDNNATTREHRSSTCCKQDPDRESHNHVRPCPSCL